MRVLVISASKHGSTQEIGAAIADELRTGGLSVDCKRIDEPVAIAVYDAIVLGSAVYVGHWMSEAVRFAEEHQRALNDRPVWLFSSGPLGENKGKAVDQKSIDSLMTATGARDHKLFEGALVSEELGLKEKMVIKMVRAPYGDFRKWEEIRVWAREIAAGLAVTDATHAHAM